MRRRAPTEPAFATVWPRTKLPTTLDDQRQ